MSEHLLDTFQQDATSLLDQARKTGNNVLLEDTKESIKVLFDIENIYKHSLSSGSKFSFVIKFFFDARWKLSVLILMIERPYFKIIHLMIS